MGPRCLGGLLGSGAAELRDVDADSAVAAEKEGLETCSIVVLTVTVVVAELRVDTDEPLLIELPVAPALVTGIEDGCGWN